MKNRIITAIKNDNVLNAITPFINGMPCYIVGGYLRDLIIKNEISHDRDVIIVGNNLKESIKNIAQEIDGTFIELDKDWEIYRVVLKDKVNYIDFAKAIDNDIEKDIKRRDITINSIAFDLNKHEIIDYTNGLDDIKKQRITTISEQNIIDDPLRLLRIFRFSATLGFSISEDTKKIIKKHANLILKPAKERINAELIKLFSGKNCANAIEQADNLGMLEYLLPNIKEIKKIPPNSHHHLDLFHHSLETLKQIDMLITALPKEAQEILNDKEFSNENKLTFLKIAALLHDIGKPMTWTIDENTGRHRFIKHDEVGSNIVKTLLKDLKFSKKQINYIKCMIKNHIYPSIVDITNEKAVTKFFRKLENNTIDVILLAMADRLSARGEAITDDIVETNIKNLNILLDKYLKSLETLKPLPKLLSGTEIMEILNMEASPKLGVIIKQLKQAQEDGNVISKEDAIDFIKTLG